MDDGTESPAGSVEATAGGYSAVPLEADHPIPEETQLPKFRLTRRAGLALLVCALTAGSWLCLRQPTTPGLRGPALEDEAEMEEAQQVVQQPYSCAKFGCLDVRTSAACGCSYHCVQDGNCCPDYHGACSGPAVLARLGSWTGCNTPGPVVPPPGGWHYVPHGPPLQVKVLSYNPEWWHTIEQLGGNGNSVAKVIFDASNPVPFDLIGFQEFYDPWYGLTRPGFDAGVLLRQYMFIRGEVGGPVGTVIGFRNSTWVLLAKGQGFVGEDRKGPQYFGKRIALWARFQHRQTGKTVFMMNHHGPLPTNTGGVCGSMTTASNLLHLIAGNAKPGDAIVFVGDFNANFASVTINQISQRLHRCFGGIDNIFTNLAPGNVLHQVNLPSGGSDHAAIAAMLQLPGAGPAAPA